MDFERCSLWSFSNYSSSASSSSSSLTAAAVEAAEDRMVRMELEAAEALADLAHLAMQESSNGGDPGGSRWGSRGKRPAKKRVKSESPPADSVVDTVPTCLDHAPDRAVVDQQSVEPVSGNVVLNAVKIEQDKDLPKQSPNCGRSYPSYGGGRSKQNLTEAEKEARRLRRILANRESARQTIRRRQALCEELTRKAADLTWENENLKSFQALRLFDTCMKHCVNGSFSPFGVTSAEKEKELALKEYQSLETTNRNLKAQMAKVIKNEAEESHRDHKSDSVEMPTNPVTNPYFFYNQHPLSPLYWPSIIQSSNPVRSHNGTQNGLPVPTNISMPADANLNLGQQQKENLINGNEPRTPLYMLPCSWFFPGLDHGNGPSGSHSRSIGSNHVQGASSMNNQPVAGSSSKDAALLENQHSLPVKVKSDAASSAEVRVINDLNETPVGFPLDGGGQYAAPRPEEIILNPLSSTSATPTITVKNEAHPHSEYASRTNAFCTKASQLTSVLSEKNRGPAKFPSKKLMDAAAAMEARKRRKELTRLKNLNGRQCRTNC